MEKGTVAVVSTEVGKEEKGKEEIWIEKIQVGKQNERFEEENKWTTDRRKAHGKGKKEKINNRRKKV
jgi:hypothetical protein